MGLRGTGKVKPGRAGVIASERVRRLSVSNKELLVDDLADVLSAPERRG